MKFILTASLTLLAVVSSLAQTVHPDAKYAEAEELQIKTNGYRGIWYMNQPSNDEYVYKYSGGMATYTEMHRPLAIYSKKAQKTFFCFGGTDDKNTTLLHNVSYFDHKNRTVANPTAVIDKRTTDAHDNPVISLDDKGHIWLFSTSHGTNRPSYIHKSVKPYDIERFERVNATEIVDGEEKPLDNFAYFQIWHVKGKGFMALYTKYTGWSSRIIGFNTSKDGVKWKEWQPLGQIDEGHYQVSDEHNGKIGTAFNYHPNGMGMNYRTNLYYLETTDFGKTWQTANGTKIDLPLKQVDNPALVKNFKSEGLNCYMKDMKLDKRGRPIIMIISSKGYQAGPKNNPRSWELFAFDKEWNNSKVTGSDNNYDTGSLYIDQEKTWRIIGPTKQGPQLFNPGGEVAIWQSSDSGKSWEQTEQLTQNSTKNHNYVRRPENAHPDFYGYWADGHGRQPSESSLYFCNKDGDVFELPRHFTGATFKPTKAPKTVN